LRVRCYESAETGNWKLETHNCRIPREHVQHACISVWIYNVEIKCAYKLFESCRLLCLNVSIANSSTSYKISWWRSKPPMRGTAISPRSIPSHPGFPCGPTLFSQGPGQFQARAAVPATEAWRSRPAPCERTATLRHPNIPTSTPQSTSVLLDSNHSLFPPLATIP
jgi:hypothetical protein